MRIFARSKRFRWISLAGIAVGIGAAWLWIANGPQLIVNGLRYGSMLMLGGIGLTLTYKIMNFGNFAHGDMMAVGAYLALFFNRGLGFDLEWAFLSATLCTPWVAIALDRILYRRMRRSKMVVLVIASFGVALFLRNLIQAIAGVGFKSFRVPFPEAIHLPFGIRITVYQLLMMITALALVAVLQTFLRYTRTGKAMRATADNPSLAQISGINTEGIILWTWGIGGALAAAGGVFFGLEFGLKPDMGLLIILPLFASAILGGIGSPVGALAGGLIIGVSQNLLVYPATPLNASYKPAVSFLILILILLIRPQGLFGGGERSA